MSQLTRTQLVQELNAQIEAINGGPSGANGSDNTPFLAGIARGLEIAIGIAERDYSKDPREECDKFLAQFAKK